MAKVRVGIDTDERYPDYYVSKPNDYGVEVIEVDQETVVRWAEAEDAYNRRSNEIRDLLREARKRKT